MSTAEEQAKHWQANIRSKIGDVRKAFRDFYPVVHDHAANSSKYQQASQKLGDQITGLRSFYAAQNIPPLLNDLWKSYQHFTQSPKDPGHAAAFFKIISRLDEVLVQQSDKGAFDEYFEAARADGELEILVTEVVGLLRQVLDEGDDVLSAAVIRELETIIGELDRRQYFSLNELFMWLTTGGSFVLCLVNLYTGNPHYAAVAATLASAQAAINHAQSRMQHCHDEATKKALESKGLVKTAEAIEHHPHPARIGSDQPQSDAAEQPES